MPWAADSPLCEPDGLPFSKEGYAELARKLAPPTPLSGTLTYDAIFGTKLVRFGMQRTMHDTASALLPARRLRGRRLRRRRLRRRLVRRRAKPRQMRRHV